MCEVGEWDKARRVVMVRQKVCVRPKADDKTLRLFADDEEISGYRYGSFVTSLDLPAAAVPYFISLHQPLYYSNSH